MQKTMRTAGMLYIQNRKLLLAYSKNKRAYYLPGGKADDNETTLNALLREIKEELNVSLSPSDLVYHTHIRAIAFGEAEEIEMQQDCFLCTASISPSCSAEIEDTRFFDHKTYLQQPALVPGVLTAFALLKEQNLVD